MILINEESSIVLAKTIDSTISWYWVAPDVSERGPVRVTVRIDPTTEQVFSTVTDE